MAISLSVSYSSWTRYYKEDLVMTKIIHFPDNKTPFTRDTYSRAIIDLPNIDPSIEVHTLSQDDLHRLRIIIGMITLFF